LFGGVDMNTVVKVVSEDGRITRACHNDLQVLTGEIGDNKDNDRKIICALCTLDDWILQ